jgi:transcription-repair coupling factor (superfamily II helicase)
MNFRKVGFDLYIQMLEEAILKLKDEKQKRIRTSVNLNVDLYIPDNYISDDKQKVEFYQRLERASSDAEVDEIQMEMEDRFGIQPDTVRTFIKIEKIRVLASLLGIQKIYEEQSKIVFNISKAHNINPEKLVQIMSGGSLLSVNPQRPNLLYLKKKQEKPQHSKISEDPQELSTEQSNLSDTLLADIENILHSLN